MELAENRDLGPPDCIYYHIVFGFLGPSWSLPSFWLRHAVRWSAMTLVHNWILLKTTHTEGQCLKAVSSSRLACRPAFMLASDYLSHGYDFVRAVNYGLT